MFEMELQTCFPEFWHILDYNSLVLFVGVPLAWLIVLLFEYPELIDLLLSHN